MEKKYENFSIKVLEAVQAPKSSSSSTEDYMDLTTRQDTRSEYAEIKVATEKQQFANTNELEPPKNVKKILNSKILIDWGNKNCRYSCILLFLLIFILLCSAFIVYNYYQLRLLTKQIRILDDRESHRFKESSNNISDIYQKQIDQEKQVSTSAMVKRSQIHNLIQEGLNNFFDKIGLYEDYPINSCRYIRVFHPYKQSDYYWINNQQNRTIQVYCSLSPSCIYFHRLCSVGSMRITKLNKIQNRAQCFPGLKNYPRNTSSCVTKSDSATCSSTFFSTFDIPYSIIHGRIRAYGVGTPDGFRSSSLTINDNYVDGISLTAGSIANRQHIHTFVPKSKCSFTNIPSFVSYDYDCLPVLGRRSTRCSRSSCSQYFSKTLATPTTEAIEMRVCRDQSRSNEDIIIEDLEIYVT